MPKRFWPKDLRANYPGRSMMRTVLLTLAGIALLVFLCFDWRSNRHGVLNVLGSTSIQPFAEMLAQEFNGREPGFVVDVQGGGSTAGIQAAMNGVAEIGMCSRNLKQEEAALFRQFEIARDGLAIVVHRSNPIESLTRSQVRALFAGEITNWKEVGGDNREVRLITREEGSGTREAFQKLVMGSTRISRRALTQESNGAVSELVKHDPCAVGYMSLGLVGADLKALAIDGVAPTMDAAKSGRYPLIRPFLFVTRSDPSEKARAFIDFVLSAPAQDLLRREGLIPIR